MKRKFELRLTKTVTYDQAGNKIARKYNQLIVSFLIRENREILEKGINMINNLPKGLVHYEDTIFRTPEEEFKLHIAFLRK